VRTAHHYHKTKSGLRSFMVRNAHPTSASSGAHPLSY
jgi:hypothetical protein